MPISLRIFPLRKVVFNVCTGSSMMSLTFKTLWQQLVLDKCEINANLLNFDESNISEKGLCPLSPQYPIPQIVSVRISFGCEINFV